MKKSFVFASAIVALMLAACSSQNDPVAPSVTIVNNSSSAATDEPLPGLFSVAPGHYVRFAPGNLQYLGGGTNATWRFADEQYNYWGFNNSAANKNRDLFGFGQTGYANTAMNPSSSTFPTGIINWGGRFLDKSGAAIYGGIMNTNWDWGMYCSIENGGGHPGMWRTLSENEWTYLMKTRPNAEYLHAYARVALKNGYMILPDNFAAPAGLTFNYQASKFDDNDYCYADWKKMEAAGAVFLPCNGCYDMNASSTFVYFPDQCGYYWTSTMGSNSSYGTGLHFGYRLSTNASDQKGTSLMTLELRNVYKYYGCAVRLVREAQ